MPGGTIWITAQRRILDRIDGAAARLRPARLAAHLATGERGEREALFELRRRGYVIVAQRWRSEKLSGDVDLIGWDGEWLCLIEVKTRRGRDPLAPAESAVDEVKRRQLRLMARAYVHRFPERLRRGVKVRFDVVSVYLQASGAEPEPEIEVFQGAFGWV